MTAGRAPINEKNNDVKEVNKKPNTTVIQSLKHAVENYYITQARLHHGKSVDPQKQITATELIHFTRSYYDSTIFKDISNIKADILKETKLTEDKKTELNLIFAELHSQAEKFYYKSLSGNADSDILSTMPIKERMQKLELFKPRVDQQDSKLTDEKLNSIISRLDKINDQKDDYLKKLANSIKEQNYTKHSEAVFREISQREKRVITPWMNVDVSENEQNHELVKGNYKYKKQLTEGTYKKNDNTNVTLFLDKIKDSDDWQVKFNAGGISERDFTNAAMESIDLLMTNGAKLINLSYSKFDSKLIDHYLNHIEWIQKEVASSKRHVLFEVDEDTLKKLRIHVSHESKFGKASQSQRLNEVLTHIDNNNKIVRGIEKIHFTDPAESIAKLEQQKSETIADEINFEQIRNKAKDLDELSKNNAARTPKDINADASDLEKIEKAIKFVEHQKWRIEYEHKKANADKKAVEDSINPDEKNASSADNKSNTNNTKQFDDKIVQLNKQIVELESLSRSVVNMMAVLTNAYPKSVAQEPMGSSLSPGSAANKPSASASSSSEALSPGKPLALDAKDEKEVVISTKIHSLVDDYKKMVAPLKNGVVNLEVELPKPSVKHESSAPKLR